MSKDLSTTVEMTEKRIKTKSPIKFKNLTGLLYINNNYKLK